MSAMSDTALQAAPASKARGYWATVGRRIMRDKVSMACAFVLAAIFLSALCAPWLGLADPYQGSMIRRLRHIGTPNYPLGTDELGRDMLARLIYGGRTSLMMGLAPVAIATCTGGFLGIVAEREWDAIQASQKLKVEWSNAAPPFPDADALYDHLRKAPVRKREEEKPTGNVDEVFKRTFSGFPGP